MTMAGMKFAVASVGGLDSTLSLATELTGLLTMDDATPSTNEDLDDIRAALGGDEDAYARIVQRYQPVVFRQMWRFTRDRNVLDELVQEVFVEAYFSLKGYRAKAPFLHWLRRIATRTGYRHWKREGRQSAIRESAVAAAAQNHTELNVNRPSDAGEIVYRYLEWLAPADRLVLTLLYLDGCGTDEIAERTGWSRTLVRVRAHRARNRLRRILEDEGIEA